MLAESTDTPMLPLCECACTETRARLTAADDDIRLLLAHQEYELVARSVELDGQDGNEKVRRGVRPRTFEPTDRAFGDIRRHRSVRSKPGQ